MSAGRSRLGTGAKGFDKLWVSNAEGSGHAQYVEDNSKSIEYVQAITDYANLNNSTSMVYPSTATFQLDKRVDQSSKLQLIVARTALTCGPGGVAPVFNDFEGYSSIDEVIFSYSNIPFWRIKGRTLYNDMILGRTMTDKERQSEAKLQNGFLPRSRRVALAAAPGTWVADLQVPWDDLNKQLPQFCFPDPVVVTVTFKSLAKCTQSADVPSCTITNCFLRVHGQHMIMSEQRTLFDQVMRKGVNLKITSNQFQDDNIIPAGSTSYQVRLYNIKGSVIALQVGLLPQANIDTNSTLDLWNYQTADQIWISDNSSPVTDPLDITAYNNYFMNDTNIDLFPQSFPNIKLMHVAFCREKYLMASENMSLGDQDFSAFNNPELNLNFNTPTTVPMKVYVRAICHNRLQYMNGFVKTLAAVN